MMSPTNTRIVTGLCLAVALIAILFAPIALFPSLIVLLLILGSWEWGQFARYRQKIARVVFTSVNLLLFAAISYFFDHLASIIFVLALAAVLMWMVQIPILYQYPHTKLLFSQPKIVALSGILIMQSTCAGLLWLYHQQNGQWLVALLVFSVAIADSGAYFFGRAFGKHKLAPSVSPGKTCEGVYGGAALNIVLAILIALVLSLTLYQTIYLLLTLLVLSILSVVGDLYESAVKRGAGMKDSGNILPGHGGILDRVDGICGAVPWFVVSTFLYVRYFA